MFARKGRYFILMIVCLCFTGWSQQPERVLPAVRLGEPPILDGELDDPAWQSAGQITNFIDPYTGQPAQDNTVAWMGYDEEAIYVAFRCLDSQPEAIVAREIKPGAEFEGEDFVTFHIDPFYSRQGSLSYFSVNALGTQSEWIAGGRVAKREWRGEWQAAVKRTPEGWQVEMRIPWVMLNRPSTQTPVPMGIDFTRYQARTKVSSRWSQYQLSSKPENIGVWQEVLPPSGLRRSPFRFLGYMTPEWNEHRDGRNLRSGLDVRYTPTPQLTAVGSWNPDFRNIEAAIEGIEFSRSERFLSEARPFFIEGSDFFVLSSQYGIGRMFYSRRIDDFDTGVKLFGKPAPDWSIGALTTFNGRNDLSGVVNVRRDFVGRGSANFYTLLKQTATEQNLTIGGGATYRTGHWELLGELVQYNSHPKIYSAHTFALDYAIPRWFVTVRYLSVPPGFDPPLAYVPFNDRRGTYLYSSYENEYRSGWLRRFSSDFFIRRYEHFDGRLFEDGYELDLSWTTRRDYELDIGYEDASFDGERDSIYQAAIEGNVSDRFRQWRLGYEWGKRAGKSSRFLNFGLTRRLFGKIDIGFRGSVLHLDGQSSQYILTIGWEMDAKRAITGRIVKRDNHLNWYLTYRSSGFSGQEIYLIIGDPNARRFTERAAFKIVWAF